MGSRRDLIMSRVIRPVVEDRHYQATVPNLLCSEAMPISPDSSCSVVENSDLGEDDFRNDTLLKRCLKNTNQVEPNLKSVISIERARSPSITIDNLPALMTITESERRTSMRKSCHKPSTSHATENNENINNWPEDFDSDDSVKDKNYSVLTEDLETTDLDTSFEENEKIKKRRGNNKIKLCRQRKGNKLIEAEGNFNQDSQDQPPNTNIQKNRVAIDVTSDLLQAITEKETIEEAYTKVINNEERHDTAIIQSKDTVNEDVQNDLTKRGTLRKRKIMEESLAERRKKKKIYMIQKLSLKEPCKSTCYRLCTKNISLEQRENINSTYAALDTEGKAIFIKNNVTITNVKSRSNINIEQKRKQTYKYFFTVRGHENPLQVCKTYFLATLGYNPKNDSKVFKVLHSNENEDFKDKRGKYDRSSSLIKDKNLITLHIKSYNPAISHYRREHAPHRLYLPSDVNVTTMHADFNKLYPDSACSYEVYRRILKSLNISFAVLGNEECELCAVYDKHTCQFDKAPNTTCSICSKHVEHRERYRDSRKMYKLDKENVDQKNNDTDTVYVCVDLQKVVMLPRMESYKIAIFCPRIIAFNETFAPLGKFTKENSPYAVLWHEALSGRNVHDIVSAFRAFLIHHRNKSHLVIWADNCSAQNKNWTLFSYLVNVVNSEMIEASSITMKYLEPGHTFNSADSFHHQVEKSLKKMKNVCDFDDYVEAVRVSNSGINNTKLMNVQDFYKFGDFHSEQKMRALNNREYIKNFVVVKFVRGEYNLFYKKSHTDEAFQTLNFLQVKILKNKQFPCAVQKSSPRGIASSRKEKIVKDLVPLMLPSRRRFWVDLPVDDASLNLSTEFDA